MYLSSNYLLLLFTSTPGVQVNWKTEEQLHRLQTNNAREIVTLFPYLKDQFS